MDTGLIFAIITFNSFLYANAVTFRILNYGTKVSIGDTSAAIRSAFSAWGLFWEEKFTGAADIKFQFMTQTDYKCSESAMYAYFYDGRIVICDMHDWTARDLKYVITHEIGHAMGLTHQTDDANSIMLAAFNYKSNPSVRDLEKLRALMGVPRITIKVNGKSVNKALNLQDTISTTTVGENRKSLTSMIKPESKGTHEENLNTVSSHAVLFLGVCVGSGIIIMLSALVLVMFILRKLRR